MGKAKQQPISPDNPQERIEEHPAEDSFLVAAPPCSGKPG